MNGEYDPRSHDAVISQILQRLEEGDRTMVRNHADNRALMIEIRDQVIRTNGRVSKLEAWRNWLAGALATVSTLGTLYAAFKK